MSRIVVGIDGSSHADRALHWAVREAELRDAEVELVFGYTVHVHGHTMHKPDREYAQESLDTVIERNRMMLDRVTWLDALTGVVGDVSGALTDAGEDADLIVVGSRGTGGFAGLFMGSTGYRTAVHASTPVAVIRGDDETIADDGDRPLVVGVDGSRSGLRALRWAFDEAARRDVGVTVVSAHYLASDPTLVSGMPAAQLQQYHEAAQREAVEVVERALARVGPPDGVHVTEIVVPGTPAGVLLDNAGRDRLLVVGTHGRGAVGRTLFGSVSHQVLHHATGSVVVVP